MSEWLRFRLAAFTLVSGLALWELAAFSAEAPKPAPSPPPATAEKPKSDPEGLKGRVGVSILFSGIGFLDKSNLSGTLGWGLAISYGLLRSLGAAFEYSNYSKVNPYVLAARYNFRAGKQFIPYLETGLGFFQGNNVGDSFSSQSELLCTFNLTLKSCSVAFASTYGAILGGGLTWFFTESRRWAFQVDYRLALTKTTQLVKTTVSKSGGTNETRSPQNINYFGAAFGLAYSF